VTKRAVVVIPTYNEYHNIRPLMDRILALSLPLDVFFVDDASPDGTGRLLDEICGSLPRTRVLHRPGKLGLGTAYREAYRTLLKEDYAYFLQMDADLSHRPEDIRTSDPVGDGGGSGDRKSVLRGWRVAELASRAPDA
jgi:glycosyltransferase involved in cell wall biosynthesis